jgi:peptidoglycan hydrolase-like protein with peptidoglycan-binding domain
MRTLLVMFAALVAVPAAEAACPVAVSSDRGAAPLRVTFRATCESSTYRWRLGDGRTAVGATVRHTFGGGRFTPTLTTDSGVTRVRPVTSVALSIVAPRRADYGEKVTLRARVKPQVPVRLRGQLFRQGRLTITVTHPFLTAVAGPAAVRKTIVVKPRLDVRLDGSRALGSPLRVVAVLRPAHAGKVQVRVDGRPSLRVPTDALGTARIVVSSKPKASWAGVSRVVQAHIHAPSLSLGSKGPGVVALEERLRELHYALRGSNGVFEDDDHGAVLAFQKVNGLERTGVVTPQLWALLDRAGVPRARYRGDHVEVDKTRQVLFLVRDGKVALTTHVSTGATGNTPLGRWHVYNKVAGWSWVLWYPSYFLRGFAIHGYPEVPAYPASHGCVRVPMWLAPWLYERIPMGGEIYVYD